MQALNFAILALVLSAPGISGATLADEAVSTKVNSRQIVLAGCPTCEGGPSATMDNSQPADDPYANGTYDNSQSGSDPDSSYALEGKNAPVATMENAQPVEPGSEPLEAQPAAPSDDPFIAPTDGQQ